MVFSGEALHHEISKFQENENIQKYAGPNGRAV
jgi:hypothetical protein